MADYEYIEDEEISAEASEESRLEKIKNFFQVGDEPKSVFQIIALLVGIALLVIAFLNFSAWQKGVVDSGVYLCIAFFSFVGVGTYLGGEPKIIALIAVLLFLFVLGLMLFGKNPADIYSKNKGADEPPPYEHVIVFDKNSVGSPGHSKRFKYDRYLRVIVENGPVKAILSNNINVELVPGQHPAVAKKGEILSFESLGESKVTIIDDL
jgi:hypothetical protein